MRRPLLILSAAITLLLCAAALPLSASVLNEPQEQRYLSLLKELRCLVCQNQSLAESGSGLAADLRTQIRVMIAQGDDDEAIQQFAVDRYSDFILYNPRFKPQTYILWAAPIVSIVIGLLLLFRQIRKQQAPQENQ